MSKKIARSLGRNEVGDAARIEKNGFKRLSLDHIVKERYPTFVDALRDLDDALSLLFLFASLPSTINVPPKTIALCRRLCLEFQHYLIITHSLRKSFLSIKGIYYQATIQGQDILWLVPYNFVQRVTGDVDFRIMGTFVEFYTTLLGFVNFRLFTSIGLVYPPKFDTKSDERGGDLDALVLEGLSLQGENGEPVARFALGDTENAASATVDVDLQKRVDQVKVLGDGLEQAYAEDFTPEQDGSHEDETIDEFQKIGTGGDALLQPHFSNAEASTLFSPFTFFLSREAPRQPLEFILRAFGCKRVGWDEVLGEGAYTNDESDMSITHQIIDRPPQPIANGISEIAPLKTNDSGSHPNKLLPGYRVPGRTYIQPQWVWDCINEGRLLRSDLYAPGATLPPHLSPWVKARKGAYDPTVPLEEQEREGEAEEFAEEEAEAAALEAQEAGESNPALDQGHGVDATEDTQSEVSVEDHGMLVGDESEASETEDTSPPFDDHEAAHPFEEEDDGLDAHQTELEAEAAGLALENGRTNDSRKQTKHTMQPANAEKEARKKGQRKRQKEEEELQRRMGMMSGKKRKLLEKMMHGKKKGEAQAETLRRKRRKIEQKENRSTAA